MAAADRLVLDLVESTLLHPVVLELAVTKTPEKMRGRGRQAESQRADLNAAITSVDAELLRLTSAICHQKNGVSNVQTSPSTICNRWRLTGTVSGHERLLGGVGPTKRHWGFSLDPDRDTVDLLAAVAFMRISRSPSATSCGSTTSAAPRNSGSKRRSRRRG